MLAAIVAGVLLICALATSGVVWLSNLRLTPPEAVATATPQGTPTPTPLEVPVLNEDATSNWTGWSKSDHCFFRDGMYHVVGGYLCYSPADEATDAVISADIQQVAGETRWFYGIMFRATNQGTFDAFLLDSNGEWQFSKFADGKRTDIVPYSHTSAVHLGLGVTNTLKVRTVGSHFQFFINGVQVGEADDSGSSGRFCGIFGGSSTGGVEIGVSRFTMAWLR